MSSKHKELKAVLKRNELAVMLDNLFAVIRENLQIFALLAGALVVFVIVLFGFKIYHMQQVKSFNEKFAAVNESLLKEQNLQELIKGYANLPAHDLARIQLAQYQVENQNQKAALQTLSEGLDVNEANILTTVLVLKSVGIYKSQNQFQDAAQFLETHRAQLLPTYLGVADLLKADLYLKSGDESKARLLLTQLSQTLPESTNAVDDNAAQIASQAKEKLLQLELKSN